MAPSFPDGVDGDSGLLPVDPLATVTLPDLTDPASAAVESHAYVDPVSTQFINTESIEETYGPVDRKSGVVPTATR